ncbi:MAG: hypothetical protein IPH68_05975 [Chitinophagaceae bacterium]|nr:hypothetical protein [Chitinophagaceae bacterium]
MYKRYKTGRPGNYLPERYFKEIGRYPDDLPIEDWYFYQRAACLKRILFVDLKVALYRVHGENFSGVHTKHTLKLAKHILKVYRLNFWFYPGSRYKLLAVKGYIRVLAWYLKLLLKKQS